MQHHKRRAQARGKIERGHGVLERKLPVAVAVGGKFVQVRRRAGDAHRQRTKIVQRGNLHLAGLHGLEDARHQAQADAVAQLGVFEAQFADFAQHSAPIGVARGIPARGEGIHGD